MYTDNRRHGLGRGSSYKTERRTVPFPPNMLPGAIIGKGGNNIKMLQARSGARVFVHSNSSQVEVSVPFPPNMLPGAIIGKGGNNIKMLQARSGARVFVHSNSSQVEVSGSAAAVEEAVRLLHLQFDGFKATGGCYPHPMKVMCILDQAFGSSATGRIGFLPRNDEVTQATGRADQLYDIMPGGATAQAPYGASSYSREGEELSHFLARVTLGSTSSSASPPASWLFLPDEQPTVLHKLVEAAKQAVDYKPAFDEMKVRFNFGKYFFYKGVDSNTSWTIEQLKAKSIPGNLKAVYSNAVLPSTKIRLEAWLTGKGFRRVETKSTASVHVHHPESNRGYTLSFNKAGPLSLRELKSGNIKLAFMTLLSGPDHPDWRAKLLAQNHFNADASIQDKLTDVAAAARLSGDNQIMFPGLSAHGMIVDKERHKDEVIYQGTFSGTADSTVPGSGSSQVDSPLIRVTVSEVVDAAAGQATIEVAGTSPVVNQMLLLLLRRGSMSGQAEEELLQHLDNMVAFAHAAMQAVAV